MLCTDGDTFRDYYKKKCLKYDNYKNSYSFY